MGVVADLAKGFFLTLEGWVYLFVVFLAIVILCKLMLKKSGKVVLPGGIPLSKRKIRVFAGSESKPEARCREIFEAYFHLPFKKERPDWLINPKTGRRLELDGFNSTIKTRIGTGVAFEYDGVQHAVYTRHFHPDPQSFVKQGERDSCKDRLCRERRIVLIRIPHQIQYDALEQYIHAKIKAMV